MYVCCHRFPRFVRECSSYRTFCNCHECRIPASDTLRVVHLRQIDERRIPRLVTEHQFYRAQRDCLTEDEHGRTMTERMHVQFIGVDTGQPAGSLDERIEPLPTEVKK